MSLLQGCAVLFGEAESERLFRGAASIDKLAPAMRRSPLVVHCPSPAIGRIEYGFRQFPGQARLGGESFQVSERIQGIAGLAKAGEGYVPMGLPGIDDWAVGRGRVVSCGGLFTLAFSETQSVRESVPECFDAAESTGSYPPRPNRRYAVTQINEYTGDLFPLQVGKELTFTYSALFRTWTAQTGCVDRHFHKSAHYTVIGVSDAFLVNGRPVPGRVYLIERKLSDEADETGTTRDYYFSETLGWVVMEVEYNDGIPGTIREMTDWQPE
ncbi:MAG: hypothetical protein WBO34_11625 [Gammaproteobacteria bacterium]